MIELYNINNKINDDIINQMYDILIENLFITYPHFLENKDIHNNKDNYIKWSNNIKDTNYNNVLVYKVDKQILGFLNFGIVENNVWIFEVQINNNYKNKKILKKLLNEFLNLVDIYINKDISININPNNKLSYNVFTHIGFKNIEKNLYKININDLVKYIGFFDNNCLN